MRFYKQKFLMCFNMKDLEIYKNYSLKNLSTFKIGGNADFVFICHTSKSLLSCVRYCKKHNIKFKIIGLGANLLFSDERYKGAIIVNKTNNIEFEKSSVTADSGTSVGNLINKCYLRNLSGLENLAGIPATVGGAVVNNLGSFNTTISEFIDMVEAVDLTNLNRLSFNKNECDFNYRHSIFQTNKYLILKVKFNLNEDSQSLIRDRITTAIHKKVSTQPLNYPSAGSVFKRGEIIPAKVIDELGLKGVRIGDAEISTKHSGFIVNLGNATSEDVKNLIDLINDKVKEKFNTTLTPEIEFVE